MTVQDEIERFLPVAASISDGGEVSWHHIEADLAVDLDASNPAERALMDELKVVAEIAKLHRSGKDRTAAPPSVTTAEPSVTPAAPSVPAWGQFERLAVIGEGTYGVVYRARDPRLDREVALKLMRRTDESSGGSPPSGATRLVEEGRLLARVRHANVVMVLGADRIDGRVGIWMELVRGRTLEQVLRDQGPLGAREAALVGIDVLDALGAVHGAGLVHGDVKAQNIMREDGGRLVLMDFSAGREPVPRDDEPAVEEPGVERSRRISGTPLYLAPEVLAGGAPSIRSDLYSVGVLLHHLVSGGFPVEAPSLGSLREAHARGESRLLRDARPDVPRLFADVVERALSADPSERHATAGEMQRALAAVLERIARHGDTGMERGLPGLEGVTQGRSIEGDPTTSESSPRRHWRETSSGRERGTQHGAIAATVWTNRFLWTAVLASVASVAALAAAVWLGGRFLDGAAGGAYTIRASLLRRAGSSSETLASGARVRPSDELFMQVEASRPLYVYVVEEDDRGEAYLLFPLPDLDARLPLAAAVRHSLPGTWNGKPISWKVTSAGGREHFLIVASRTRLDEFEKEMSSLARPRAAALHPDEAPQLAARLSHEAALRLRGVGELTLTTGEPPSGPAAGSAGSPGAAGPLFAMAARLADHPESARGVWMRRIDLENPAP